MFQLRSMDPSKRNCYYENEKELDFFPVYSEPNCALECAWKHARETCGCVPWFLKTTVFGTRPMCEAYGNMCFRKIVNARYGKNFGDVTCMEECLPDCNEYSYSATVAQESKLFY